MARSARWAGAKTKPRNAPKVDPGLAAAKVTEAIGKPSFQVRTEGASSHEIWMYYFADGTMTVNLTDDQNGELNPLGINCLRVFDVYGNVQDRDLGGIARDIKKILADEEKNLARGSFLVLRGQVQSMNSAFVGLGGGLIFAIVLVYALMVVNFQSWLDPFIIITALPGALSGILLSLFVTQTTINVPSLMGAIMSMGVATANSILIVSFARSRAPSSPRQPTTVGIDGTRFTLHGRPTFLLGISYYAGLGATDEALHRKVGIVGMGRIGQAIGRRLDASRVPVVYHSRKAASGVAYQHYPDLIEMAKAMSPYGGIYITHMRSEADQLLEAVEIRGSNMVRP